MIWRCLNVDFNSRNVWFPLPPRARITPVQHAFWNALKGPSDTTTKLVDSIEEKLGIRSPRTVATARLLSVGSVAFHRSSHMLHAANKGVDKHRGLDGYRHASIQRQSMADTIIAIEKYLKHDLNAAKKVLPESNRSQTRVRFDSLANIPPRRTP